MDTKLANNIIFVGFAILIFSLFNYQIIKGPYFSNKARANYVRLIPKEAIRGSIFDRNRQVLAQDRPIFNVAIIPYQIKDKDLLFSEISKYLNIPQSKMLKNYKHNVKGFFSPVDIVVDLGKKEALALKEELGDKIMIRESLRRTYPFGKEFSHVLGYVRKAESISDYLKTYGYSPNERVGSLGAEQYYDLYLKGKDGGQLLEVDSSGKTVGFLGIRNPERGKDVSLTIDRKMQRIAYDSLEGYKGVIVLMDPNNGEIFVMCSSPSYDLNDVIRGKNVAKIFNSKNKAVLNRAIQLYYPLGSVFKTIVALAGLEEEKISDRSVFYCVGRFMLGNYDFGCSGVHGQQNLLEALTHSCNVYFYNLGMRLGIDKISYWAKRFGLGKITGIDLPYEKKGILPDAEWKLSNYKRSWFSGDTANLSIGQGYLNVTPLQSAVLMSVFANGGYLIKPHILKSISGLSTANVTKEYIDCSKDNLNQVNRGLRSVVKSVDGTAHTLDSLGLSLAGKTGTAQNIGENHGWFGGFFPYKNPKYTISVFLENAGSSYEALKVAKKFLLNLKKEELLDM